MDLFPSIYERIRSAILQWAMTPGQSGYFTISDICSITGLSTTSVAKNISKMQEDGLLVIIGQEQARKRGRRAIRYGLTPGGYCFLGVDIKSNCLGIGAATLDGNLVYSVLEQDFRIENTHECLERVCSSVHSFINAHPDLPPVSAANFNIGGRVNAMLGTSASIFNFEETQDTPLAEYLSERMGFPVYIENDTKAMAYGEFIANSNKGWKNILFVNISWGLGMGIIIDGRIYYGSNGFSGEIGHMRTYDNNILCHCGKRGCMETELSGQAIVRKLTQRIQAGEPSVLSRKVLSGDPLTTDDIIAALEKEDSLCIELVSQAGSGLGLQLAGILNLLNPECIIIGGTLSKAASYYFLQYISLAIRQHSLRLISQRVPVLTSTLGDMAGIHGACLLARDRILGC